MHGDTDLEESSGGSSSEGCPHLLILTSSFIASLLQKVVSSVKFFRTASGAFTSFKYCVQMSIVAGVFMSSWTDAGS
jgi:hypothetical protein